MARRRSAGGFAPPAEPADDPGAEPQPPADPEAVARTICLRLLTIRARTRVELADALAARDVPPEAAEVVLGRLAGVGLIDDRAFAASFVSSRQQDRGLSAREITRQLKAKGIDADTAAEAVIDIDAESEAVTARRLVQRKLRSMSRLEPQVQTRRLVGMLARKGYAPGMAFQVVREVLGEQAVEANTDDAAWLA